MNSVLINPFVAVCPNETLSAAGLFSKVPVEATLVHKDGDKMIRAAVLACLISAMLATSALANSGCKVALHVERHRNMSCSGLPGIETCDAINHTYSGCDDIDVFPVFYDIYGITGAMVGLTWPDSWGSCAFTPCGFDFLISDIVHPGDSFAGTWTACQYIRSAVVGFGWLAPSSGGRICPIADPSGFMGVTDCEFVQFEPVAVFCAGACGTDGDNPCGGGVSEEKTWGSIKSMYR